MLLAALMTLALHQGVCPKSLTSTGTTISALSNSQTLSLCVANSVLVHGTNGKLTLVIGSSSAAPRCLIYPNGLSPDLTLNLLQSGHVGCWSLYPPSQPVAIVNVGTPNSSKINTALKSFQPQVPVIYANPSKNLTVGKSIAISSSAHSENIKASLLNLPVKVRFTPKTYSWTINQHASSLSSVSYVPKQDGLVKLYLKVSFAVEYQFTGLTSWTKVSPNILVNAVPRTLTIGSPKVLTGTVPRLVFKPCRPGSWGC